MTMEIEEFMDRFADFVLFEIDKRGCSQECFAELCGISRNEIGNILRRKKRDIYMSTVLKICNGTDDFMRIFLL